MAFKTMDLLLCFNTCQTRKIQAFASRMAVTLVSHYLTVMRKLLLSAASKRHWEARRKLPVRKVQTLA